jgi:fructokinase
VAELIGGIEAGGTTFRCATARVPLSPTTIADATTVQTATPQQTMDQVLAFFRSHPIERLGIASFGPLQLDPENPNYGCILDTPKLAWRGYNLLEAVSSELGIPCTVNTDVAAAVRAEYHFGAAQGVASCVYATIGTGIGAASLVNGKSPAARFHEEMGHMLIPQHPQDDFDGACIAHDNCLEGLASALAIYQRWNQAAHDIPNDHLCWDIEATYLATFCVNVTRILSPELILLGGGVMQHAGLLDKVRGAFRDLMGAYHTVDQDQLQNFIRIAQTEPDSGLIGALSLVA